MYFLVETMGFGVHYCINRIEQVLGVVISTLRGAV